MHVEVRNLEDVILVDLEGRLVAGVGDQILRDVMNELIAEGWQKILLNLSGVSWIDSSGIGELVAGIRLAKPFQLLGEAPESGRPGQARSLSQPTPAASGDLRDRAGSPWTGFAVKTRLLRRKGPVQIGSESPGARMGGEQDTDSGYLSPGSGVEKKHPLAGPDPS